MKTLLFIVMTHLVHSQIDIPIPNIESDIRAELLESMNIVAENEDEDISSSTTPEIPNFSPSTVTVTKPPFSSDKIFFPGPNDDQTSSSSSTLSESIEANEFPTPTYSSSNYPTDSLEYLTSLPSITPSYSLSNSPTESIEPSYLPSSRPSSSVEPTIESSSSPSISSTSNPSQEPTYLRSKTYWNYDPNSKYGPHNWDQVGKGEEQFQEITGGASNRCDAKNSQSPIVLEVNSACKDDHETHTQRGNKNFDEIEFRVEPHALRAVFPKNGGSGNRAPRADFSNLSHIIPASYMDVKIPGEHQIKTENGDIKTFPGEVQIAHDWGRKVVNIAFFIDYEMNEHNEHFEDFIRKWEDIHLSRLHECANKDNKNFLPYKPRFKKRSIQEMETLWGDKDKWPGSADYDLYRLQPSVYYYGYEGGSTTPPCGNKVYWRIQDLPMQISHEQYERIRAIILDQKDENCKSSSKAYKGGVNRPIQKTTEKVWHCGARDWFVKNPKLWCSKWPLDYHGRYRIDKACP